MYFQHEGQQILNQNDNVFSPDAFAARLREIRKATGRTGAQIAQEGNITKQTFSGYLNTGRLPSASVLANWVFRLGINANWLLTGEGAMLLEQGTQSADPVVQRVAMVVDAMREAGAEESDILQSVRAMLEGELGKLEKTRGAAQQNGI
jgi:transcriptional regulator with XRE-family HTH domain